MHGAARGGIEVRKVRERRFPQAGLSSQSCASGQFDESGCQLVTTANALHKPGCFQGRQQPEPRRFGNICAPGQLAQSQGVIRLAKSAQDRQCFTRRGNTFRQTGSKRSIAGIQGWRYRHFTTYLSPLGSRPPRSRLVGGPGRPTAWRRVPALGLHLPSRHAICAGAVSVLPRR